MTRVHRVLRAVRDRVHVCGGTANGVAGGHREAADDYGSNNQIPDHVVPPLPMWNDNESERPALVQPLRLALAAVHRVLGAVRDRIYVASGAADRVARRRSKRSGDNENRSNFLDHDSSPSAQRNAEGMNRLRLTADFRVGRSDGDWGSDVRVGIVILEHEVLGLVHVERLAAILQEKPGE